jgi:thymidylate kinase
MQGSNIESILAWANNQMKGIKSDWMSPLRVADTLYRISLRAEVALERLEKLPPDHYSSDELDQTLSDIDGFAMIGRYYEQKIRGACMLAMFEYTKNEQYRKAAIMYLEQAKTFWNKYATIYTIKNKPALYNRVGYVDMEKLKENVQADIDMVKNWKPGSNPFKAAQKTEVPFKQ